MPCHLQTKEAMARANLGVDTGDPSPLFCGLLNISELHVQYGIQTFAKFKRPESDSSPVVSTHLIIPFVKEPVLVFHAKY